MSVKVTKDDVQKILKDFNKFSAKQVLVGIPGEIPGMQVESAVPGDPPKTIASNAYLGYIHNFGSTKKNIPARPFLLPGVQNAQGDITKILEKVAKSLGTETTKDDITKGLKLSAEVAVSSIKEVVVKSEGFKPLKINTIKQRERKKIQSKKPLIRTASLLNSITYIVRGD